MSSIKACNSAQIFWAVILLRTKEKNLRADAKVACIKANHQVNHSIFLVEAKRMEAVTNCSDNWNHK